MSGVGLSEDGARQANMGIAMGDYLHTGRMSILISHFDNEYAAFYRNDGDMNFTDVSIPIWNRQRHARVCRLGRRFCRFR